MKGREDPTLVAAYRWFRAATAAAASEPKYSGSWHAIFELLERLWFTRSWIVQDTVVSGDLQVVCRSNMMAWEDLSLFLDTLLYHILSAPRTNNV
jgi:hypothetical protein